MRNILTAAVIFAATLCAADQAREQTLQRAIDLMESKGDLAKAMPLFEEASRSADKGVAARALLYLGQGQERAGIEKARETYARIIREFGAQTESVAVARQRLATLGGSRQPLTLTKRLVCSDCGDSEADLSADGRWMVLTDWDSGDLAVRDMNTGIVKRLLAKAGSWKESDAYGESPTFSPDLTQIAYLWEDGKRVELRVMPNETGGKARTLVSNPEYTYFEPAVWSRDGKAILTLLVKPDDTWQIAWVSAADGSVKVLKSLEWRLRSPRRGGPRLSPDGRYIAYSALSENPTSARGNITSTDKHIYVLASDGSSESEVVKTAGLNQNPVWTPDGKRLLFSSDRGGSIGLWSLPIQDGKATGIPSLVMADLGDLDSLPMVRNSYLYTVPPEGGMETVEIAEAGSPVKKTAIAGVGPVWSPDGKQIAFSRPRPAAGTTFYDLVVHSLETGEETVYSHDRMPANKRWFADGKAIQVYVFQGGAATGGLYRVDLKTKEFQLLMPFDPELATAIAALSPDGKTIYMVGRTPTAADKVVAVDLATRQKRTVTNVPPAKIPGPVFEIKLSPNGETLAIRRNDREARKIVFSTVRVDGSGYRDVHTVLGSSNLADSLEWTSDSRGILFTNTDEKKWRLMRIPADGGTPEATGIEGIGSFRSIALSPDRKRLAYSTRNPLNELWAIDNIAPVSK